MREIADMRARALDDLAIGIDQRIGLARERRDLDRKFSLQPLGGAGADGRETRRDAFERRQTETDLEDRGQQQHERKDREGDLQRAIEGAGLVLDLDRIARDRDEEVALLAEIDGALDQPQLLVFGAGDIALPDADIAGARLSPAGAAGRRPRASARRAPRACRHRAA